MFDAVIIKAPKMKFEILCDQHRILSHTGGIILCIFFFEYYRIIISDLLNKSLQVSPIFLLT
jgi:hypothetical protein